VKAIDKVVPSTSHPSAAPAVERSHYTASSITSQALQPNVRTKVRGYLPDASPSTCAAAL